MLFCLTACVGEGNLVITKLGRQGNDINRINEPVISHADSSGNGIKEPATIPKPVFSAFFSRSDHNFAINEDGELYAWGRTYYGQLGNGTISNKNSPVKISTATNWVKVTAGNNHSLAINSAGELYAWGSTNYGQLGNGTSAYEINSTLVRSVAVKIQN